MNEYSINITSQFREELDEIYYYIYFTLSSPNTAKVLYSKIKKTIFNLNLFPERYPKLLISKYKHRNIRKAIVNNFIIVFEVDNISFEVFILHIFHGSQAYWNKL